MTFVSYNSRDWTAVELVVKQLQARGIKLAVDQWYLSPGLSATDALEDAMKESKGILVFYGPYGIGQWQRGEIELGWRKHVVDRKFCFVPVILPGGSEPSGFASTIIHSDLRDGYEPPEKLDRLAATFRRKPAATNAHAEKQATINPYRSLLPFREEDADYFFGREAQIAKLLDLIPANNFLAVVAASGSGKSSMVMAGLVPALRRQRGWGITRIVPTSNPWSSLAAEVVPVWQPDLRGADMLVEIGKVKESLSSRKIHVKDIFAQIAKGGRMGQRFLLIVDQWEEIYSLCADEKMRNDFIDELLDAAAEKAVFVLLTLRGDFYAHALRHRRLADALDQKNLNLGPLTSDEIRAIIEKPAAKVGLHFEQGLVEAIQNEVGGQDTALPLLEYLLAQMWQQREGDKLTFEAYKNLGKLGGAIAQSAERAWAGLIDSEQQSALNLFLRLVQLNLVGVATRRRALADELTPEQMKVAKTFVAHRILVTSRDPATACEMVEVAHEALLLKWGRFTELLRTQREFLLWHRRLDFAVEEYYDNRQQEPEALLNGHALDEAAKWIAARRESLSERERVFIERSMERQRIARELRLLDNQFVEHQSNDAELKDCEKVSDRLWPSYPENIPGLEQLRERVRNLLGTIAAKQALLEKFKSQEQIDPSPKVRWQMETLGKLIDRLKDAESEKGLFRNLERRIERARTIVQQTIHDQAASWRKAAAEVLASPRYSDLKLSPQIGLIPLGMAPESGLAEFLHVESHEGEIPRRQADGTLRLEPSTGIILVLLPGGKFFMGAQNASKEDPNFDANAESLEAPVHEVKLSPFFISKYLLTQAQWERLTHSNPSRYRSGTQYENYVFTPLNPVESIPWRKADSILTRIALQIPTEAQWEYAARAGTSSVYWTGDAPDSIMRGAHLLFNRLGLKRHAPVGSYDPNAFGIYDVIGNLWEFTADWACFYTEPARDGDGLRKGSGTNLIIRGASFFNSNIQARIAYRTDDITPDMIMSWMGVRSARAIDDRFANEPG
jgi:formylglycine-generating enzyme required for sulfatase activity